MSMIKCPECGRDISDQATNCPSCGYPLGRLQNEGKLNGNESDELQMSQNANGIWNDQSISMSMIWSKNRDKAKCVKELRQTYNLDLKTAEKMVDDYMQKTGVKSAKKKDSGLSIAAAICGFFTYTYWLGIILAIIDLIKGKNDQKRHLGSYFALVMGALMLVVSLSSGKGTTGKTDSSSDSHENTEVSKKVDTSEQTKQSEQANKPTTSDNEENKPDIKTASSNKDMSLGEIGVKDNVYVGLSYVKKMSYLPTALGSKGEIGSGNEVILAFFDFYNNADKSVSVSPGDITCYADGTQVEDVESYIKVECDGISQYYSESLADHAQLISVQDYEVPIGWKELKFFYKSECIWTVDQDDVKTEDFEFQTMYTNISENRNITPEGTIIYNDKFEIKFQGATSYIHQNSVWGEQPYIVFKFTINNTGTSAIDYNLAGYKMTAYQNNYYLGDASYSIDEKIDGYSNIFNIDSIEAGMSANIYVAFDGLGETGSVYMIYDDGYINSDYKGSVYLEKITE